MNDPQVMEMSVTYDRRKALMAGVALAGTAVLASCTQTQVDDFQKQVADVINQIQAGVVAACVAVGKFVPTANSVVAVLIAMGGTNPALITAAMITAAIADIAKACPAAPQGRHPEVAVRGVSIVFY